jgi:multicomponent K+:H+ antiporter subunit G
MTTNELPVWIILPAALLLIAGGLLTAIGSLGLLRLEPFYARMHGPSIGNTLGLGCVLTASMLISSALAHRPILHEILVTVFMVITAPLTAILLMLASVHHSKTHTL